MAHGESKVLNTLDPTSPSSVYLRYVENIFPVVPEIQTLHSHKEKFEVTSALKINDLIWNDEETDILRLHCNEDVSQTFNRYSR